MRILSTKDTNSANDMNFDFHFPTSKKAIIIFARNPELGKCKTRLAETIGDHAALNVYKYLLQHTANITEKVTADKFVFYSEHIHKNDIWDEDIFIKKLQQGSDLGVRMKNAFLELFNSGYEKIVILGSDILDLKSEHISKAFHTLDTQDVVIGPAFDGGYYLLGMKQLHPHIFENKRWGTHTVLKDTLEDLKQLNTYQLETLNDIDTFEDLNKNNILKELITND
ncbi:TIGR04282 family arsenosugar biosynthesis glycosyltransferase [Xanthomarina sp. F2636L]|uniref:TIGR04282 family arsenosugar biosynthesis glycosyltransferase n=1 Tax=Xanthomarina sp. F2636L TaxID=2996018 RepID=UPI00225E0ECA|nr:TIGR04282 family arsenosugar biosynthesis glycosyltransferase [Xanthomarina sp. F2636L]MCX7550901.1 TIGR04282 family arsenosugar biosynthesis glycosyltransferase [Xanthomarina sp. F2636L]